MIQILLSALVLLRALNLLLLPLKLSIISADNPVILDLAVLLKTLCVISVRGRDITPECVSHRGTQPGMLAPVPLRLFWLLWALLLIMVQLLCLVDVLLLSPFPGVLC